MIALRVATFIKLFGVMFRRFSESIRALYSCSTLIGFVHSFHILHLRSCNHFLSVMPCKKNSSSVAIFFNPIFLVVISGNPVFIS